MACNRRTDPQVAQLLEQLASAAPSFFSEEVARMQRVQRSFVVIERAELGVIVVSAALPVWLEERPRVVGVALGLPAWLREATERCDFGRYIS